MALYERFEQIKKYPTLYPIRKERSLVIMYGTNVRRANHLFFPLINRMF
jgi:hypothetical protein